MDIEAAFYKLLNTNTAITDFFEDIEPLERTSNLPCLSYQFISHAKKYMSNTHRPRVQLDIWGKRYSHIKQGRNIINQEIDDWRGTWEGFDIKLITKMGETENEQIYEDLKVFRQTMDFRIIYQE